MITEKTATPEKEEKAECGYEWGIIIEYDGKRNTLFHNGTYKEYPIGGVLCECMRIHPTSIREVIRGMGDLRIEATDDNIAKTAYNLCKRFYDFYPPAAASMIAMHIYEGIGDWGRARRENRLEEYKGLFAPDIGGEVFKFIFEDTPYDNVGDDTVEQIMLSIYLDFARCFNIAKYAFMKLMDCEKMQEEPDKDFLDNFLHLYSHEVPFQHIDFRLALIEGRFASIFTIHSVMSLLLFEFAHIFDTDTPIMRCKNCGEYFIQEGRRDAIYCNCPSPQKPEKTCTEIGAQIARANKEKNDTVTRAYRKTYMRYQMKAKRHPDNAGLRKRFYELSDGMREWRKALKDGTGTVEEFLEWLQEFE